MKRLLSTVLALSLLGGSVAYADPYGRGYDRGNGGYEQSHHDWNRGDRNWEHARHRDHDNNGAAIAAGVGLVALFAIMASQNHESTYDRDRAAYQRGYDNGAYGYDNRSYGYDNGGYDR